MLLAYIHVSWDNTPAPAQPLQRGRCNPPAPAPSQLWRGSDPKVMCGNERKGGEQGGSATKQLQAHCECRVIQKISGERNEEHQQNQGEQCHTPTQAGLWALPALREGGRCSREEQPAAEQKGLSSTRVQQNTAPTTACCSQTRCSHQRTDVIYCPLL